MQKNCPVCNISNVANGREGTLDRFHCSKCNINYYISRETIIKQGTVKGIPKKGYK